LRSIEAKFHQPCRYHARDISIITLAVYRDHVSLGERDETSDEGSGGGGDVGGVVDSGSCR